MAGSLHRIAKDGFTLAEAFSKHWFSSTISITGYDKSDDLDVMRAVDGCMVRPQPADRDAIIDFFDRSAEIRKLVYYSSLLLVLLIALYGSAYVLIPDRWIPLGFQDVAAGSVFVALVLVQIPYFVGQKRLSLELTRGFSGMEWREMTTLLGKQSPAWNLLHTGELLGAGLMPPLAIWLLTIGGNALKSALNW